MDDYQRTMCDNVLNAAIVAGTAPLCLTWTATKYAKNSWKWLTSQSDEILPVSKRKSILVTERTCTNSAEVTSSGISLHIIRALGKAGHRVIFVAINNTSDSSVVPERKNFVTCYSKYVYRHYNVNLDSSASEYEQDQKCISEILSIARKENVDWYIPMSSNFNVENEKRVDWYSDLSMGNSLLFDVTLAKMLKNMLPEVRSFVNCENPYATRLLSDKLYFLLECKRMNLNVPDFHLVESAVELRKLQREGLFSDPNQKYYITSMHQTMDGLKEIEYSKSILCGMSASNSNVNPFHNGKLGHAFQEGMPHLVCQYITGHHFIANVVCREGNVLYSDICSGGAAGKCLITECLKQRFQDWIMQFSLSKRFDGLLSFEFIVEDASEEVFCVGCKPYLDLSIIKRHKPEEMNLLEKAIRLGLEARTSPVINTLYASAKFESNEMLQNSGDEKRKTIHFEASIQSKIVSSSGSSKYERNWELKKNTLNPSTQKSLNSLKPEYVYWIKNELDKWFDRKQGFFDLTNVLINGKEANFDEDDPLPFTAAHLLQLPDLFWNTISPSQDSKPE